jgi:hypothetical protein
MTADVPHRTATDRATDRPGDASPFALGLLLRQATEGSDRIGRAPLDETVTFVGD